MLPAETAGLYSESKETREEVNFPQLRENSGPSQSGRAWVEQVVIEGWRLLMAWAFQGAL